MKIFVLLSCVVAALASEEALQEFTAANNKFSATVYKEIVKEQKSNFLVSPFSAETILAFTQSGAKGTTAQEVRTALHLPDDTSKIEDGIKSLLPKVKESSDYTLHTANKMYVKDNFEVNAEFEKVATDVYSADAQKVDFLKKEEAAGVINSWVEEQTNSKIKDLLDPELLTNRTRVVLVNALYYKANWSDAFELSYTEKLNFYKTPSDSVEVNAMHNRYGQNFLYFECHHLNAKFLELPFKGGEASMTFILPNDKDGLANLESQIDRAVTPHNVTRQRVNVALPKFKIESKVNLKKILQNLGVKLLFTDFESDLSGVAGKKGDLVVSEVIQKSFIDVNEEGVEAAAATFSMVGVPMMGYPGKPFEFVADHPFLFYIKVKGVIIFIGRVTDPSFVAMVLLILLSLFSDFGFV